MIPAPMSSRADAAAQDITKPDFVELHDLHAKMEMQDKSTVNMSADTGDYDMKSEHADAQRQYRPRLLDRL